MEEDMIDRRAVLFGAAALCAAVQLGTAVARADQAFQRFLPFLVDLDGWQGNKPDGLSMEMAYTSMITAKRDYTRGAARLHASVVMGPAAAGALAPTRVTMNMETPDGHVITAAINGMPATRTYDSKALQLANKFNW